MVITWMIALMIAVNPFPVAQGGPEFKTLEECKKAIDSTQDENMKARMLCVAIKRNYI